MIAAPPPPAGTTAVRNAGTAETAAPQSASPTPRQTCKHSAGSGCGSSSNSGSSSSSRSRFSIVDYTYDYNYSGTPPGRQGSSAEVRSTCLSSGTRHALA